MCWIRVNRQDRKVIHSGFLLEHGGHEASTIRFINL